MIIFESPRKRANRFLVALRLFGILTIASIMLTASEISLIHQLQAGVEVPESYIDAHYDLVIAFGIVFTGAYVVCAILFLMWKHKASKNLRFLGVSNQRFSPGLSVAYYFIPIFSLFRPYQAMKEIYLRSVRAGGGGGGGGQLYSVLFNSDRLVGIVAYFRIY